MPTAASALNASLMLPPADQPFCPCQNRPLPGDSPNNTRPTGSALPCELTIPCWPATWTSWKDRSRRLQTQTAVVGDAVAWDPVAVGDEARWVDANLTADRIVCRTNSLLAARAAARAGTGVAALPCYLGDPDPATWKCRCGC